MPSRARHVKLYKEELPLFFKYKVEDQLDAMHSPTVQLPSGGSIVMHATEALIAIDVNSGKSTRERHIDETAVKTNLEAADEIARQLRLRDLAGLVVIDFIDMAENRHQRAVEKRMRDALKIDRARIQLGRISMFGLLELSRQRLRPSLQELSSQVCPTCQGLGSVRSTESCALQALRLAEEAGIRGETKAMRLLLPSEVALYVLNHKRDGLLRLEQRYAMRIEVAVDRDATPGHVKAETLEKRDPAELAERLAAAETPAEVVSEEPVPADDESEPEEQPVARRAETADGEDDEASRKRRRRRRRRRRSDDAPAAAATAEEPATTETVETDAPSPEATTEQPAEAEPESAGATPAAAESEPEAAAAAPAEEVKKPKRRRRTRKATAEEVPVDATAAETPVPGEVPPAEVTAATEPEPQAEAEAPSEEAGPTEAREPEAPAEPATAPEAEAAPAPDKGPTNGASEPAPAAAPETPVESPPRTPEMALAEDDEERSPARQGWWSRWVR
jgi:ribonuclease E